MRNTKIAMGLLAAVTLTCWAALAHAGTIIDENFTTAPTAPAWSITQNNGATLSFSGGQMIASIASGANAANNQNAFIAHNFNNSGTQYEIFHTSFVADFSNYIFTVNANPQSETTAITFRQFSGGNNPLAQFSIGSNDYNDNWRWSLQNGIQYGGGNHNLTQTTTSVGSLAGLVLRFDLTTTVVHHAGLSWTISSNLIGTNTADNSTYLTMSNTTTGNAVDSTFNPLTGVNEFSLGIRGLNNLNTPAQLAGSIAFDDFKVTGATAVPLPAAVWSGLGIFGVLGIWTVRRRSARA